MVLCQIVFPWFDWHQSTESISYDVRLHWQFISVVDCCCASVCVFLCVVFRHKNSHKQQPVKPVAYIVFAIILYFLYFLLCVCVLSFVCYGLVEFEFVVVAWMSLSESKHKLCIVEIRKAILVLLLQYMYHSAFVPRSSNVPTLQCYFNWQTKK